MGINDLIGEAEAVMAGRMEFTRANLALRAQEKAEAEQRRAIFTETQLLVAGNNLAIDKLAMFAIKTLDLKVTQVDGESLCSKNAQVGRIALEGLSGKTRKRPLLARIVARGYSLDSNNNLYGRGVDVECRTLLSDKDLQDGLSGGRFKESLTLLDGKKVSGHFCDIKKEEFEVVLIPTEIKDNVSADMLNSYDKEIQYRQAASQVDAERLQTLLGILTPIFEPYAK